MSLMGMQSSENVLLAESLSQEEARPDKNSQGTIIRNSILAQRHMWVEFVVGSRLGLWVFLRVLQFSSLHKN